MYKKDMVKQSQLFDFIKSSSIDQTHELEKQKKSEILVDIESRLNRKEFILEKHLINIRRDVERTVVKRLQREDKDLEIVIERLLYYWSNYLLCNNCDALI